MTNEEQILALLKQNQQLSQAAFESSEKTRKYILYTGIFTIIAFVLPLLALALYLPTFIDTFTSSLGVTDLTLY